MLDYEWGNPPTTIVLSAEDQAQEPDPTRPGSIFDPTHHLLLSQTPVPSSIVGNYGQTQTHNHQINQFHHAFYDPRASFAGESTYAPTYHPAALFSFDQTVGGGGSPASGPYFVVPKTEEVSRPPPLDFTASRIGLNLGGRTYFSAADDDFVSRLYRRSRPGESAVAGNSLMSSPRCQAEGCNADLSHAKHYHRRHKVCEFHSKAATVIAGGLTQRFCQQCSRFHLLSEFDNGKRSCRKRLADHNRRRRKSNQSSSSAEYSPKPPPPEITTPRSPNESGAQSSSSLTVPLSPPTISLDCFRQRHYQATASSSSASSSSNSIFFSSR